MPSEIAPPAVATLRDGGFLLLVKVGDDKAIVQLPHSPRPTLMTCADFEQIWDGRLLLMTRRAGLSELSRRFDVTWFLGAVHKYRGLLSEVLLASFFVQLFALISPRLALFFVWLFSNVLSHAFDSWLVPFLGFFLLPWTTLIYALTCDSGRSVEGFDWFLVAIAFLIDLSSYAGGGRYRRGRD